MNVHFWRVFALAATVATLGFTGTAWANDGVCTSFPLNFSDSQYTTCFTDVRRGADINDNNAPDLGGTGHTALNFTGGAGPAEDTWLTRYTPDGAIKIYDTPGQCVTARCPHPHVQQREGRRSRGASQLRPFRGGQGVGLDPV
jgi:hypothetical protein